MKFWRPLGTSPNRKIFDFGGQHGGKLAPKSVPKSMLSSKGRLKKKPCFSLGKNTLFWDPGGRSWEQKSIKNRCKKRCGNRRPRKLDFYRFLVDLGGILALQNGAKTLQNRCWKGIKIWSVFEGLLERDFFGPRGAKTRQRRRSPQRMESARAYWGRI